MKPMKQIDAVRLVESEGFSLKANSAHKRYEHTTGISLNIPHSKMVSPAMMRDINRSIKRAKELSKSVNISA